MGPKVVARSKHPFRKLIGEKVRGFMRALHTHLRKVAQNSTICRVLHRHFYASHRRGSIRNIRWKGSQWDRLAGFSNHLPIQTYIGYPAKNASSSSILALSIVVT